MKALTAALIAESNKLSSANPWLFTLDVTWPSGPPSYLVRNTENIIFQTRTYVATPMEIDATRETSKGEIPSVTVKVSNVLRALAGILEAQNGGVGATVVLRLINAALLTENYADLELTFTVMATSADADWVVFTLGMPNPFRDNFPMYRYFGVNCNWVSFYKGAGCLIPGSAECNSASGLATCDGTLANCVARAATTRFGGFPGISGGIKVA